MITLELVEVVTKINNFSYMFHGFFNFFNFCQLSQWIKPEPPILHVRISSLVKRSNTSPRKLLHAVFSERCFPKKITLITPPPQWCYQFSWPWLNSTPKTSVKQIHYLFEGHNLFSITDTNLKNGKLVGAHCFKVDKQAPVVKNALARPLIV